MASSIGVALLATTLTVRLSAHLGELTAPVDDAARTAASFAAYQDVFWVAAAVAALGVVVSLFVRNSEAAASRGIPAPEPTVPVTPAGTAVPVTPVPGTPVSGTPVSGGKSPAGTALGEATA
ncbi:hypothetical protein [Nakamurella aerolata]|uniref:Uncharacterized protein n=1 Tax=Nakamurella aerolata TaxID=1656892 RepID=A0A849A3Q9_9ACTN|nr:hypothetical protein [Nakamurella aerolata]NNG35195.1 hypothetical protein [Nakamurella aerolata]